MSKWLCSNTQMYHNEHDTVNMCYACMHHLGTRTQLPTWLVDAALKLLSYGSIALQVATGRMTMMMTRMKKMKSGELHNVVTGYTSMHYHTH